jgi:DNA-binding transcriptional LysR family regulator
MTDPRAERFIRSHLKTRHLVLLVELGRHHSILQAAQAANLTQPAASKLLSELEHSLGVPLFERLPRGVVPTKYGEVLIRRAGTALSEMDAAYQEVMELMSGLSGAVTIGSVITPSSRLIPEAVKLLKATHPRVHVVISVETSRLLIERLRAGELDMAIARILDTASAHELDFEPLTDEPHSLIARTGHPLAERSDLTLEEVAQEAWILPPSGSILRDRLTALFISQGLDQPKETVETLSLQVIANLLINSDMVVALPRESVQSYLDMGVLTTLPFELGLSMDCYGIVTRKNHQLSPSATTLLAMLRQVAKAK